jgi:hypothetical protein
VPLNLRTSAPIGSIEHLYSGGVTFLMNQPIRGRLAKDGTPTYVELEDIAGPVEVVTRWKVDVDWWSNPVRRTYFRVIVAGAVMVEIFNDEIEGGWFVERVYD